jgi:ABC-type polysaccharide/polyol phosphate export permease
MLFDPFEKNLNPPPVSILLGLGWLTSSTNLFVSDVANIVAILIQFGFWLTPIFWNISMIPQQYHWIIKLNPVCYLIQGYRDSLVAHVPFWDHLLQGAYFWVLTAVLLLSGIAVFGKLRPHFAEVV